jgi:hypothetical protein
MIPRTAMVPSIGITFSVFGNHLTFTDYYHTIKDLDEKAEALHNDPRDLASRNLALAVRKRRLGSLPSATSRKGNAGLPEPVRGALNPSINFPA